MAEDESAEQTPAPQHRDEPAAPARDAGRERIKQIGADLEHALAQTEQPLDVRLVKNATSNMDTHLDIIRGCLDLHGMAVARNSQHARRELEHVVRLRAVACARELSDLGHTWESVARRLNVNPHTLRKWDGNVRLACEVQPLGCPLKLASPERRQEVLAHLDDVGPGIGVPALRERFGDVARAELDDIVKFYRRLWRTQHVRVLNRLHWQQPGTVWAMDFSEAPYAIDGVHPYLLAVRDLASGRQLLWEPVLALTADVVLPLLDRLFTLHGAPLVLKADNGSAFIAAEVLRFLRSWEVFMLFSPPRCPTYNGSIEASIGAAKSRTQAEAERAGHPDLWTSGNVEAARERGNTRVPAKSEDGLSPDERWSARRPITEGQRSAFQATVEFNRIGARLWMDLPMTGELTRTEQAQVDRRALPDALRAHGLLFYTRRQIPAQVRRPKVISRA